MSLNLNNHLLEAEDNLVTAVFWDLLLEVVVGALPIFTELLLLVLVEALGNVVPEILVAGLATLLRILLVSNCRVIRGVGIRGSSGIIRRVLHVLLAQGHLVLEVGLYAGHVWLLMPSVVFGCMVDLCKLII